jgi:hypothetical protein
MSGMRHFAAARRRCPVHTDSSRDDRLSVASAWGPVPDSYIVRKLLVRQQHPGQLCGLRRRASVPKKGRDEVAGLEFCGKLRMILKDRVLNDIDLDHLKQIFGEIFFFGDHQ